jgi:hypothetical protein
LIIACLLVIGTFSGCSKLAENLNLFGTRKEKGYEQTRDKVFEVLDSKDKEALKQLFAMSVISENPDLDKQIDDLFLFYNGPKISADRSAAFSSEKKNYGVKIKEFEERFVISTPETKYHVSIIMQSRNDQNNDDEGIHILEFATEEAYDSVYFLWHKAREDTLHYKEGSWYVEKVDVPGIYIQASPERCGDVIRVNSRNFRYKAVNRNLAIDDFLAFISKSDNFDELVDSIGEPNTVWSNYGFYYFELEDKRVVVCNVEYNKIKYMYVADEEQELYMLWTADNTITYSEGEQ